MGRDDARKIFVTHPRTLAENTEGGLWIGWSFGAQVLVEMFHQTHVRPSQLVLINPCYGRRPDAPRACFVSSRTSSAHARCAIDVPTLVILGDKDSVTPRVSAEPLAKQIPHVEVFVVRQGTHFVLLEFPELINLRIEKFLREQVG